MKDIETSIILVGLKLELPRTWSLVELLPLPAFKRFSGLFDRFEEYADAAVKNTKLASKGLTKTMFSKMVGPEDHQIPERVIRQEAVNIMIAGTDTTAMTLTYLMYAVLAERSGNVRKKLLDELQECSDKPSWSELENLPYLNRVFNETLRLYSPVGGSLPRTTPLEGATFGTLAIPAGTIVMSQSSTFHTDPRIWRDPLEFDPDRWIDPTPEMKENFMPFGGSARSCLGQNIARLEVLQATARLLRQCPNLKLAPSTTEKSMKPLEFFVGRPRGGKCEVMLA